MALVRLAEKYICIYMYIHIHIAISYSRTPWLGPCAGVTSAGAKKRMCQEVEYFLGYLPVEIVTVRQQQVPLVEVSRNMIVGCLINCKWKLSNPKANGRLLSAMKIERTSKSSELAELTVPARCAFQPLAP